MSGTIDEKAPRLAGLTFLVEGVLDADGSATVLRISDRKQVRHPLALKVIKREEPEDNARISRAGASCAASAKLHHPAILHYHDFRLRRSWFRISRAELLMELVEGRALDRIDEPENGPWVLIFREVAAALAHMHRRGVLHGDIKPSRIMLSTTGHVKVLGYGQSLLSNPDHGRATPEYAAPERIKDGVLDEKTDIYALGATIYRALTGQVANAGRRSLGETGGKISTPSALNPSIPAKLNNLIIACLQSGPARRPESMYEIHQRLDAIVPELDLKDDALKGAEAWARGDLSALRARHDAVALCNSAVPLARLQDRVAADWAKDLKLELAKPGKVMVAADLDNLTRKGGLLDQLKAEGLEVIGPAY